MTEFTESELLRLAQRLEEAERAGYVLRKAHLCNIKYDGAGRVCAYRHRHRFRLAAWLCGRWQAILRYGVE